MCMVSIERVQALLDDICEELPEAFFKYLNGGICLLPEARHNPSEPGLCVLGDYNRGGVMGRYINIYYGSIMRVFGMLDEPRLKEQLREVLLHEFTHHIESLAGERALEVKDRVFLEEYLRNH